MKKQTQKNLSPRVLRSVFSSSKKAGSSALNISKLIEHYAYAEAIVASLSEPMVILDKSLKIKSANNAFFKLFKLHKKEIYGKSIFGFSVKKEEIPNLKKILTDVFIKNIPVHEIELTHKFERVGEKTIIIGARRIVLDGYKTKLMLLSIEDISERKMKDTQKDDFVGYVTHELRTPLTSMSMFIQLLTGYHKKTEDKKSQFLLSKVTTQMDRLSRLLDSFADVYKAQSGKLEIKKEKTDLNMLVSEAIESFQYTQSTHDIEHVGQIKKPLNLDKERINEVIVNLLTNAIKYSPAADKIIVTLSEDEKNAIVRVQDFGMGIPKDEKEKVFERFFRVKGKDDYNIKGLGLGLYIVNNIIKQHKGKLWVESEENKGSTFSFSLPKK